MNVNINLLPPEIQEKRRAERLVAYALILVVVVAAVLGSIYVFNAWRIDQAESRIKTLEAQVKRTEQLAAKLKKYEQRQQELDRREKAISALTGTAYSWYKMLTEISMTTPNDVQLTSFSGSASGISIAGTALDPAGDRPDAGIKPIARWLIRLGEIKSLTSVWPSTISKGGAGIPVTISADIGQATAPAPPKPPAPSGK